MVKPGIDEPLEVGEIEETIIETEDPQPEKRLGELQKSKFKKKAQYKGFKFNDATQEWEASYDTVPTNASLSRDSCGEGSTRFYQNSSRSIWKRFPVLVYVDERNYPGTEPKSFVRNEIINSLRQVNYILGFGFFSVRLDPLICKMKISFEPLDTGGIGHCSWRTRDGAITSAVIRLNTATRWFINPYEQCYSSGRLMHMPATMLHEVGHGIGLGHNNDDNKATMRPYGQAGETLRATAGASEKTFIHKFYDQYKP